MAQHFARDVQAVWSPLAESFPNMGTREELDQFWQLLNQQVSEVAFQHFGLRPGQRSMKILPSTFDVLREKRQVQATLLTHAQS